jgi:hypothetical protein
MSQTTRSECVFEDHIRMLGFEPIRIEETANQKQPDYRIDIDGKPVYFEVKEFNRPEPLPSGGFSPLPFMRRKIRKARTKFDQYKHAACCLVVFNEKNIAAQLGPYAVMSAMFGECYQHDDAKGVSFSGPAQLRADSNTTLSAVITLRPLPLHPATVRLGEEWHSAQTERGRRLTDDEVRDLWQRVVQSGPRPLEVVYRATVLINPYGRGLPEVLFRGPFDEWWERRDQHFRCTFRGTRLRKLWEVLPDYALASVSGIY